ncbi:hypothetical protein JB92DRAFT_2831496 [Gautieria morchelliformis]|nr:hypothetical protein JB92DRAFT_2831496 [Gautieria morchelliformis]
MVVDWYTVQILLHANHTAGKINNKDGLCRFLAKLTPSISITMLTLWPNFLVQPGLIGYNEGDGGPIPCTIIVAWNPFLLRCDGSAEPRPHWIHAPTPSILDAKVHVLLDHCLSTLEHILRVDTKTELDARVDLIGAVEREFILQKVLPSLTPREGLIHALFEEQEV